MRYWAVVSILTACCTLLSWLLAAPVGPGKIFGLYTFRGLAFLLISFYGAGWVGYFALGRAQKSEKIKHCLITSLTFVLLWGFLELPVLFHLVDYRFVLLPQTTARLTPWYQFDAEVMYVRRNMPDKELLHIRRPGERLVGEMSGNLVGWLGISTDRRYPFDVQYDRRGFRNDQDLDQADMLVIGDSMVEWGIVPSDALVSTRLSRLLGVKVANLGQGFYGPQQELIVLRRFGIGLRPKIVLWFFFEGNDLRDVGRYRIAIQNWERQMEELYSFSKRSFTRSVLMALAGWTAPRLRVDSNEARRSSCVFVGSDDGTKREMRLYFDHFVSQLTAEDSANLETAKKCS